QTSFATGETAPYDNGPRRRSRRRRVLAHLVPTDRGSCGWRREVHLRRKRRLMAEKPGEDKAGRALTVFATNPAGRRVAVFRPIRAIDQAVEGSGRSDRSAEAQPHWGST